MTGKSSVDKKHSNIRDLTRENISKSFVRLMIPLIAGNILQQLYNTIDAFVIGKYAGENEFAAIGVASSVINLFLFAIIGSCIGLSVIFAQFYGAKNMESFRREHFLSLVSGLFLTACCAAAGIFFAENILTLIHTPLQVEQYATRYLTIILAALPATFVYNLYGSILRSVGKPTVSLIILAIAVVINITLDLLLVGRFSMGIRGAAMATAAVQILSAVLCMLYIKYFMPKLVFKKNDCVFNVGLMKKTFHYCLVTILQQTGLYIGKLLVQSSVNTCGVYMISAYTATTRIEGFINTFGNSGASVTSVLTAQNKAAYDNKRVRQTFLSSLAILSILGAISSLLMFLSAETTAALIMGHSDGSAFDSAFRYIQIISLFYILNYTGSTFAGYFDGLGKVNITLIGTIGQITFRVIFSWIFVQQLGLTALAVITGIGWILVNLYWTITCFRKKI